MRIHFHSLATWIYINAFICAHLCIFKFPDCENDLSQSHSNVTTFSNLATHTEIYTDAKLFKCELCDNECTQSGSLTIL